MFARDVVAREAAAAFGPLIQSDRRWNQSGTALGAIVMFHSGNAIFTLE